MIKQKELINSLSDYAAEVNTFCVFFYFGWLKMEYMTTRADSVNSVKPEAKICVHF